MKSIRRTHGFFCGARSIHVPSDSYGKETWWFCCPLPPISNGCWRDGHTYGSVSIARNGADKSNNNNKKSHLSSCSCANYTQ